MTESEMESRRRYISEIRKSFPDYKQNNPPVSRYMQRNRSEPEEGENVKENASFLSGFKLRLLLSVMIFLAILLCDYTKTSFYGFTAEQMQEKIEENYDYTNVKNYVMMFFDSISMSK